jgi:hypothetical protein
MLILGLGSLVMIQTSPKTGSSINLLMSKHAVKHEHALVRFTTPTTHTASRMDWSNQ